MPRKHVLLPYCRYFDELRKHLTTDHGVAMATEKKSFASVKVYTTHTIHICMWKLFTEYSSIYMKGRVNKRLDKCMHVLLGIRDL